MNHENREEHENHKEHENREEHEDHKGKTTTNTTIIKKAKGFDFVSFVPFVVHMVGCG